MTPSEPASVTHLVACPQCHRMVAYTSQNPYRPFCSERCKQIDLGAWANEQFRLPEATQPADPSVSDTP